MRTRGRGLRYIYEVREQRATKTNQVLKKLSWELHWERPLQICGRTSPDVGFSVRQDEQREEENRIFSPSPREGARGNV